MRRQRDDGFFAMGPIVRKLDAGGIMLLLFETPSGFAIFRFSEVYLHLQHAALENLWGKFSSIYQARHEVSLKEYRAFEDKSSAIDPDTGVNEDLANMIKKWHSHPKMKLGVTKSEYKTIIESNLKIPCVYNEVIMEVMWGIQNLIREFLPEEKSEVTKEDRLPMSQGLRQVLRRYEFDLKADMVNQQIVKAALALHICDGIYKKYLSALPRVPLELEKISGINCDDWDALKLAAALKVLAFPEQEIDFPEVFTQDELSKMKADAPKYRSIIPAGVTCSKIYRKIFSAHRRRIEKKKLLGDLINEAKKAPEAKPAEVYEEGERQGESEQIPQEHAFFVNPLFPQRKVLKRSWDSAFEPPCEGYHHVRLRAGGLLADDDGEFGTLTVEHLALYSEQNEVGKVVGHSARLDQKNVAYQHVELEDPPCKCPRKSAALDNN